MKNGWEQIVFVKKWVGVGAFIEKWVGVSESDWEWLEIGESGWEWLGAQFGNARIF